MCSTIFRPPANARLPLFVLQTAALMNTFSLTRIVSMICVQPLSIARAAQEHWHHYGRLYVVGLALDRHHQLEPKHLGEDSAVACLEHESCSPPSR